MQQLSIWGLLGSRQARVAVSASASISKYASLLLLIQCMTMCTMLIRGAVYLAEIYNTFHYLEEFPQGNFVVKDKANTLKQGSPDHSQEWLNCMTKKGVGITRTPSALKGWALSFHHRSLIFLQAKDFFGLQDFFGLAMSMCLSLHRKCSRMQQMKQNFKVCSAI